MATSDLLKQMERPNWMPPLQPCECTTLCDALVKQLDDNSGDIAALAVKWCVVHLVWSASRLLWPPHACIHAARQVEQCSVSTQRWVSKL
jgi:hypothetical protein